MSESRSKSWFWYWVGGGVLVVVIAGSVIAYLGTRAARADFTLTADTGILRLQTYCAQRLVWDLPRGTVTMPGALAPPSEDGTPAVAAAAEPANISLAMEGHVQVTVSRGPQGNLLVTVQRGEGADASRPLGEVTESGATNKTQTITRQLYYQSADAAPSFTLPLWGRVIVGDDVPQGSGSEAGAASLLRKAEVRARVSLRGGLNQGVPRKTIIDESLDAGDIVDTHPELADEKLDAKSLAALCNRQEEAWASVGFIAPEGGSLSLVVHRQARAFGVTRAGATPFTLSVPRWHLWLVNPVVQIFAGLFALLLGVISIVNNADNSRKALDRIAGFRNRPNEQDKKKD